MSQLVTSQSQWVRLNASTTLDRVQGLVGFLCTASSVGTLTIADAPNGSSRTMISAMACTAGTYYPLPGFTAGTVTITVGGTLDGVLFYKP